MTIETAQPRRRAGLEERDWAVTPQLRWLSGPGGIIPGTELKMSNNLLQQAWMELTTGAIEWRDVAVVKPEGEAK